MKRTNKAVKFLSVLMVLALVFSVMPVTAIQAQAAVEDENPPYAYVWKDASNVTHYQYYEYSFREDAYVVGERVISIGSTVYDTDGKVLYQSVKTGANNIGYSADGDLYVITKAGNLEKLSSTGNKTTYKNYRYTKLVLDWDDLVTGVVTSTGKEIKLSKLGTGSTATVTPTPTPVPSTKGNRVERSGAEAQTIKAYKGKDLMVQLYINKGTVLEELADVYLSSTCKGAKFLGLDADFSVYLYETGGTFYKFTYGNWFFPTTLEVEGELKKYQEDENGFITKLVTTERTYDVSEFANKFVADKTYAVQKENYVTLYIKGTDISHTLKVEDGAFWVDDEVIYFDVVDYGFVDENTYIFVFDNGDAYTATIDSPWDNFHYERSNVTGLLKSSTTGLVTHVKVGRYTYKVEEHPLFAK